MFVFLSSVLAVLQFYILDALLLDYTFFFGSSVMVATYIGQKSVEYLLRLYGRSSVIILSVALIIGLSMVMMTVSGMADIGRDVQRGDWDQFSFSWEKFCHH